MDHLRTPLARVKGLGSAKEGVSHWWGQKWTSLILVPLVLWFCFALASLPAANYEAVVAWIQSPVRAVLLILIIGATFYHAQLGLQVIIEDYVPSHGARMTAIIIVNFLNLLFALIGIYAVLKIAFGT